MFFCPLRNFSKKFRNISPEFSFIRGGGDVYLGLLQYIYIISTHLLFIAQMWVCHSCVRPGDTLKTVRTFDGFSYTFRLSGAGLCVVEVSPSTRAGADLAKYY